MLAALRRANIKYICIKSYISAYKKYVGITINRAAPVLNVQMVLHRLEIMNQPSSKSGQRESLWFSWPIEQASNYMSTYSEDSISVHAIFEWEWQSLGYLWPHADFPDPFHVRKRSSIFCKRLWKQPGSNPRRDCPTIGWHANQFSHHDRTSQFV